MRQKAHIGTIANKRTVVIENGMVERFVKALDIEDPLSTDANAAKKAGFSGLLLPHAGVSSLGSYAEVVQLLELRPKQVLHSKEVVTVLQPLCVGDAVDVTTKVGDLYEQQVGGNPMGFVTIEVTGKTGRQVLFEAQRIIAVRGGFPRR
jgi:hypothetical protein